jgi:hypothetical protein
MLGLRSSSGARACSLSALLLLLVSPQPLAVLADQVCSVATTPSLGETLFAFPAFVDTTGLKLVWTSLTAQQTLRLTLEETNGGLQGYAWHDVQERIADGFVSTFRFQIPPPASGKPGDGFTYFIQNDKIMDLNGGTGANLGAYGVARSIAMRFDLCYDRPGVCSEQKAGVKITYANLTEVDYGMVPTANMSDGLVHTVTVSYGGRLLGGAATVRAMLDNVLLFETTVGDLETQLFGSRFAWFGFSASTSWTETAQIDILSWDVKIQPSDSAINEYSVTPLRFPYGTTATALVILRDSCKNRVSIGPSTPPTIVATLMQEAPNGTDPADYVILSANISDMHDGSYQLSFNLPPKWQGKYDLDVSVGGVRADSMPWIGGIVAFKPDPPGSSLPLWGLILLLLLVLLIILVLSYIVYRLHRYRKKLKENEEFIEAGKKQAELDRLEDGLSYAANPLVGTVDDLKTQLTKNEDELARLRGRHQVGEDQDFTIQQLQAQRDNLMQEMNRLKREEQEAQANQQTQSNLTGGPGGKSRKEFGREMT